MKTKILAGALLLVAGVLQAVPFNESTFTDIVRSVDVLAQPAKTASPAKLNEILRAPDLVRTGASSRAELTAPDQSITRIGANTVFSFAPDRREINLEQGSALFHSPSGRGGGTIRSGGASAAVSGTTLIVATTPVTHPNDKNGFKVILLEGAGNVTLASGKSRKLKAGQMVYVLPNHSDFGPILTINLPKLVAGSALINGFSHPLPSLSLIQTAIEQQKVQFANGQLTDTGTPADNYLGNPPPPRDGTHAGPSSGDPNITQIGVIYPGLVNIAGGGNGFPGGPSLPPGFTLPPVQPFQPKIGKGP
jgi:quercetin dioxygenase-like cupin family protein